MFWDGQTLRDTEKSSRQSVPRVTNLQAGIFECCIYIISSKNELDAQAGWQAGSKPATTLWRFDGWKSRN